MWENTYPAVMWGSACRKRWAGSEIRGNSAVITPLMNCTLQHSCVIRVPSGGLPVTRPGRHLMFDHQSEDRRSSLGAEMPAISISVFRRKSGTCLMTNARLRIIPVTKHMLLYYEEMLNGRLYPTKVAHCSTRFLTHTTLPTGPSTVAPACLHDSHTARKCLEPYDQC